METKLTLELPIDVQKYIEELKKAEERTFSEQREWILSSYRFMIAEEVIKVLNQK